jgi:hypothetical protein
MKIIGYLLVAFGFVDFIGGFTGLDVWKDWFHITLPGILWNLSPYIEMTIGYFLIKSGSKPTKTAEQLGSPDASNTAAASHDE